MAVNIPSKKLSATGTDQTYTSGKNALSVEILNIGTDPVLIEFDTATTVDSKYIPANSSQSFSFGFNLLAGKVYPTFTDLHYKVASGSSATLYVSIIAQD